MYKNITSFVAQGTNSGKTYIIERIIEELKTRGRKVAAVKHSMHLPSIDKEGKDTFKFAQKGADRVILFSDNALMLYEMSQPEIEYLTYLAAKNIDIILVEGFKSGPFKKIEVFNNSLYDNPMCLEDPSGEYIAIISREEVSVTIPSFRFEDVADICSFLETRAGLQE